MKIAKTNLDGGSLVLALIFLFCAFSAVLEEQSGKRIEATVIIASLGFALIAALFFWQSFRIGSNRQAMRDFKEKFSPINVRSDEHS